MTTKHLQKNKKSDIMCAVFRVRPVDIPRQLSRQSTRLLTALSQVQVLLGEFWLLGQVVKTPPFHGGNRSSNLLGVIWRRSQVVRQRSATPSSPVQIWSTPLQRLVNDQSLFTFINLISRGRAVWQLVGLITRRSLVQILPPQFPRSSISDGLFYFIGMQFPMK